MSRLRRHQRRFTVAGVAPHALLRIGSLLAFLGVLGMGYVKARDPQNWKWMVDADRNVAIAAVPPPVESATETIVPGKTDLDEQDSPDVRTAFDVVSDRNPLAKIEMSAYWVLMRWARAQSFAELERRAERTLTYSQLNENSEKLRGKPIRLSLHLRRVLKYEAPENSAGVKTVYEAWGWTDDSKSYPYVVVVPELPPTIELGADVQGDAVFVGYFLKLMSYTAYDKRRISPLLVGRLQGQGRAIPAAAPSRSDSPWALVALAGLAVGGGVLVWRTFWLSKRVAAVVGPADDAQVTDWLYHARDEAPADTATDAQVHFTPPSEHNT